MGSNLDTLPIQDVKKESKGAGNKATELIKTFSKILMYLWTFYFRVEHKDQNDSRYGQAGT